MVQVRVGDLGSVAIARYLVQRVAQAQIEEFKQAQAQYESTSTAQAQAQAQTGDFKQAVTQKCWTQSGQ